MEKQKANQDILNKGVCVPPGEEGQYNHVCNRIIVSGFFFHRLFQSCLSFFVPAQMYLGDGLGDETKRRTR